MSLPCVNTIDTSLHLENIFWLVVAAGAMLAFICAWKDKDNNEPHCKDCRHYLRGQDAALCLHDGTIAEPNQKACIDFQHPKP